MSAGALRHWLAREAGRERHRVTVDDALVFGGFGRYVWQRSRRFAVTRVVQEGLHVAELYLLFLFASQQVFIAAAIVNIVMRIASAGWWGGLEVLRAGVRDRASDGRYAAIGPWIRAWVDAGIRIGVVVCGAAAVFAAIRASRSSLNVADAYLMARLAGFGIEAPVRAFHSGAYALRRIHQPMWSLLAASGTRGLLLIALWPVAGIWTIPVTSIAAVAVSAALTFWFTRRTYEDLDIWSDFASLTPARAKKGRRVDLKGARRFLTASLANAATGGAHLWTVALLSVGAHDSALWLSLFVYALLVGPLFDSCLAWARLFYPDLMKHAAPLVSPFRARLAQDVIRWSPIAGTLAWFCTLALMPILPAGTSWTLVWVTWMFFVARARFAAIQTVAFCERRFAALGVTSAALGVIALAAYVWPRAEWLWLVAILVLSVNPLTLTTTPAASPPAGLLPMAALVARAERFRGPGRWMLSEFRPGWLLHGPHALLQRAARIHGPIGVDRHWLLRWQTADLSRTSTDDLLQDVEGRCHEWPTAWRGRPRSLDDVVAEFSARCPGGVWMRAGSVANAAVRARLTWRQRRHVLDEAVAHAFGRPPAMLLPVDVSAFVDAGRIAALFFVDRSTPPSVRRSWRRWLRDVAMANAVERFRPRA